MYVGCIAFSDLGPEDGILKLKLDGPSSFVPVLGQREKPTRNIA